MGGNLLEDQAESWGRRAAFNGGAKHGFGIYADNNPVCKAFAASKQPLNAKKQALSLHSSRVADMLSLE